PLRRRGDPLAVRVRVPPPEVHEHLPVLAGGQTRADRALGEHHDLAALTSERLERGRRRTAKIARLGNEDRSVALEGRRGALGAVERAVTAIDDVELEPPLGQRLREREEL